MDERLFAYSLSQVDQGWTWSLWDEDGGVVATGAAPDQSSAQRRLVEAIRQTAPPEAERKDEVRETPSAPPGRRPALSARPGRRRKHPAPPPSQLAPARPHHRQGR